jgi:hypothetical protein
MRGRTSPENLQLMQDFRNKLNLEPLHFRPEQVALARSGRVGRGGLVEFSLKVDDKRVPPSEHTRKLEIKPIPRQRNNAEPSFEDLMGGFNP